MAGGGNGGEEKKVGAGHEANISSKIIVPD